MRNSKKSISLADKIWGWVESHKIFSTVVTVVVVALALSVLFGNSVSVMRLAEKSSAPMAGAPSYNKVSEDVAVDGDSLSYEPGGDISGIEIQQGDITAKSENTENDLNQMRSLVESYEGYIEESNQYESNTMLRTHMRVRVPREDFTVFVDQLQDRLDVRTHNLRNYRIEIEEQQTELDIIRETLALYAEMKADAQELSVGQERVDLTMKITERELELKRRENRLAQRIQDVARLGDMATVNVTLEERLSAEVWPEDIGNQLKDNIKDALESIVNILIALVTTSFVIFFGVIKYIVYIIVALIPIWFAYHLLKKLYKKFKS